MRFWGNSMAFELPAGDHAHTMGAVVRHLQASHDTLRLQVVFEDGQWRERVARHTDAYVVEDLSACTEVQAQSAFEERRASHKHGLDFAESLLRVVYYRMGEGRSDIVQLVMHHFIYDLYSMDILLQDMRDAFTALSSGASPVPKRSGATVAQWPAAGDAPALLDGARLQRLRAAARAPSGWGAGRRCRRYLQPVVVGPPTPERCAR